MTGPLVHAASTWLWMLWIINRQAAACLELVSALMMASFLVHGTGVNKCEVFPLPCRPKLLYTIPIHNNPAGTPVHC